MCRRLSGINAIEAEPQNCQSLVLGACHRGKDEGPIGGGMSLVQSHATPAADHQPQRRVAAERLR